MQIDVDRLIDDRPINGLQIRVFVLCALVAILDAVDSQSIALPVADPRCAAHVGGGICSSLFGGLFGAPSARSPLAPSRTASGASRCWCSHLLFGVFTCLTVFAETFRCSSCTADRGAGIGGATPCFITLAAEYAPQRKRAMLVSLLWAGYPFGNAVAAS